MGRFRILPYRQGSASAKALAEALGGKVLKLVGSKFQATADDTIIGWGNTDHPGWIHMLNKPETIKKASNKLLFFTNIAAEAPEIIPKFWTNKEEIPDEEYPIVCRTVLAGHSGAGIVIADSPADAVTCKLYVKYIRKLDEYRVHIGKHGIICVQKKSRKLSVPTEEVNWKVRNLAGGFVYSLVDPVVPESVPDHVLEVAKKGLEICGLDFGGCDVIYNHAKQRAYLIEINTACGLEKRTAEMYAKYFKGVTENA